MVLLHGPVQNALFCLMDRYRNVCVWFMARNCRFPKVRTHGCQRGNHRLPLQGTAGMFAFGCWAGIKMFLNEKGVCLNDMKTLYTFMVSLNQPVKNAWFR